MVYYRTKYYRSNRHINLYFISRLKNCIIYYYCLSLFTIIVIALKKLWVYQDNFIRELVNLHCYCSSLSNDITSYSNEHNNVFIISVENLIYETVNINTGRNMLQFSQDDKLSENLSSWLNCMTNCLKFCLLDRIVAYFSLCLQFHI